MFFVGIRNRFFHSLVTSLFLLTMQRYGVFEAPPTKTIKIDEKRSIYWYKSRIVYAHTVKTTKNCVRTQSWHLTPFSIKNHLFIYRNIQVLYRNTSSHYIEMPQTACFKAFQPPMLGSSSHVCLRHKLLLFRHLYFVVTHTTS